MEKVCCTDRVKNEVLDRVKEVRNIVHTVKRRKARWIGHILRRNCLIKHAIAGKIGGWIEATGTQRRKRKQLLDDLKKTREYCKLEKGSTRSHCV
jgi:ribosomal 50S subunit-associated protein YjgA (DUF615 family)